VNGAKVLRLQQALAALVDELRTVEADSDEERRLIRLVPLLLAEVGSALPDPLLDELEVLVGRRPAELSPSAARVVLAQLSGWLTALAAEGEISLAAGPQAVPPRS